MAKRHTGNVFDYDLFVIGGGSGGIRAARMAANAGARVGLAEEDRLGGTCVIRGCVPKKLMVNAADYSDAFRGAAGFGWSAGEPSFDWPSFRTAKDREISRLESIYRKNLAAAGVQIFEERAVLADAHAVSLASGGTKSAKHILVATGGAPFVPDFPGSGLASTSNDVFLLDKLPDRVLIVGGGYIACEFAGILNGLGCSVTLNYRGEQILRGFDGDVRSHVSEAMSARGIEVCLNAETESIDRNGPALAVRTTGGSLSEFDFVLYATGRRPNTAGLGLEAVGIELGRGGKVPVDSYSQSPVPSIYAVGDATDRINLTPVAIREGAAFAQTVFMNNPTPVDHANVPTAVFTRPEIGTVGMTEEAANARGKTVVYSTRFRPLSAVIAGSQEEVLMKVVVDRTSRVVLGVHIVGPGAGELIQAVGIAVRMGATKEDFDRTVAVHPTAAEELVTLTEPVGEA